MRQLNIYEAKTNFSKLVDQANKGSSFVIARSGKPLARLVPLDSKNSVQFGTLKGKIKTAKGFDDPLPDDMLGLFEADL